MDQWLGIAGLAVALYATTNVDDIFVLIALFSDSRYRPADIVVGQFIGIAALFLASVAISLLALVIAPEFIGFLGIAPIAIGLRSLREAGGDSEEGSDSAAARSGGGFLAVAAVTVANGGDNISIYTPLFAIRSAADIVAIGLVFVVMTAVWLRAARWITSHPRLGAPIRRYGHRLVPFVLIALGVWILFEAGTLRLVAQAVGKLAS